MDTTDQRFAEILADLRTLRVELCESAADIEAMRAERSTQGVVVALYRDGVAAADIPARLRVVPFHLAALPVDVPVQAPVPEPVRAFRSLGERVRAGLVRVVPEVTVVPVGAVA